MLLGRNPQELAELCVKESQGKVQIMKNAIKSVALKEDVRVDVLANYMAYRLQLEKKINIWGMVNNLQEKSPINYFNLINSELIQNLNLSCLKKTELDFLQKALSIQ